MATSPALSGNRTLHVVGAGADVASASSAVRTEVHAMGAGVGLRSVRRRITPQAGFALSALGHAIEYLADEYAHEMGRPARANEADPKADPRLTAIQILMAANREVYFECPVLVPLHRRLFARFFRR